MNIYEQQSANRRMTWVIMLAFVGFFLFIGLGFDYFHQSFNPAGAPNYVWNSSGYYEAQSSAQRVPYGTIIALLIGFGMTLNSVFNGPAMVLRSTMARRAVPADIKEQQFLNVVSEMSIAAGISPPPTAYIVPDPDLNAFATGISPSKSAIAITEGLLNTLNREELQGVVAHEMSHIRNYDMRLMTITAALIGAIGLISDLAGRSARYRSSGSSFRGSSRGSGDRGKGGGVGLLVIYAIWLIFVLLAPFLSRLLAMAISRQREYLADASGAELTRNPLSLVSALEKIRGAVMPTSAINNGVAHMCITDPRGSLMEDKLGLAADLLATHPPMQKRILALKAMAYQKEHPQT